MTVSIRWLFALILLPMLLSCTQGKLGEEPGDVTTAHPPLARIEPGQRRYYPPGEFTREGLPVAPAPVTVYFSEALFITARQISENEYAQCVAEGACQRSKSAPLSSSTNMPVTGVSWQDATDYAAWLSAKTAQTYRLPTYAEWVYAAASAYREDVLMQAYDQAEPAQRWLAEYALETQRKTSGDTARRAFGAFGENEHGVMDIGGNVWDWTTTCHSREHISKQGITVRSENCGIRVVAGAHRSYLLDFIRDPKSGACSVGVPPSHLGFRLVRVSSGS